MAVTLSCPACRSQLRLKAAPPPGAVGQCPNCRASVPLDVPDDHTQAVQAASDPIANAETVVRERPPALPPGTDAVGLLAPPEAADELGRLGPYRVLEKLGQGGMGVVFRAQEVRLNRQVALKVMRPEFAAHLEWKARFLREAHAQAAVEHEHVVAIYRVSEPDEVAYIAMPLLKGQTLGAALKQNARPPLKEAARIGREIAEGLAAAHEVGLIHRDIKPGNIWLDGKRRRVKILDFGLARAADMDADAPAPAVSDGNSSLTFAMGADGPLTVQGAAVGTPAYMSPEQARGQKIDGRSDLFSLGVVLYQTLTGRMPFGGPSSFDVLAAVVSHDPPAPIDIAPEIPELLSDLVMRLLAKSADARPQSAEAVADQLRRLEGVLAEASRIVAIPVAQPGDPWQELADDESEVASVTAAPVARAARGSGPRGPLLAIIGGATLAALIAVAAVVFKFGRTQPTATADPTPAPAPASPKAPTPPKPPIPSAPDMTGRIPVLRLDFTTGKPPGAPPEEKGLGAKIQREYTGNALAFRTAGGMWLAGICPLPVEAAVEIRARVTTPEGAWFIDAVGSAGNRTFIFIDHPGEIAVRSPDPTRPGLREHIYRNAAVKKRSEWNTLLIVARPDSLDIYVNGEEVARSVPARIGPNRTLDIGIASSGAAVVEYAHITAWDMAAPPKK